MNLQAFDSAKLCGRSQHVLLYFDGHVQKCVEQMSDLLNLSDDEVGELNYVLEALQEHGEALAVAMIDEEDETSSEPMYRTWCFEFAIYLLIGVAQRVSSQFAYWEVRIGD